MEARPRKPIEPPLCGLHLPILRVEAVAEETDNGRALLAKEKKKTYPAG
jgi:hypothetical protein